MYLRTTYDTKFGKHIITKSRLDVELHLSVPAMVDGEPRDSLKPNDVFQLDEPTQFVLIVVYDADVQYARDDVEPKVVPYLDNGIDNDMDNDGNDEAEGDHHFDSDADMDNDMDYEIYLMFQVMYVDKCA